MAMMASRAVPQVRLPLFRAAMGGHVATARYLINHGANTVASDEEGLTPLHCAARYGLWQVPLLKFLLSLGVPVDVKVKHASCSPLIVAAIYGQESSMKVGADLNFKCPLARAIPRGATEIIMCLLEAGADPNVRNEYGWLPIEIGAMCKKRDFVEMLFPLTSPVPDVHDWSVQGILQYVQSHAFKEKNEEILEKNLADLKVKGADSFKKKEYQAAICFYTEAILLDSMIGSGDATLFSNRSLCFHQMGEGDMAMMDALIAQRVKPDWPKAHYRLGAAFMLLDDYDEASGAFEEGLRLDPANIEMKKAHREALDCLRKSHFGE
ncbi:hypothetical protein LUZ63_015980 [Rhynchospora breviuscula]|uniref:Serine/threonine-protein kinase BSK1-like TPR repeats domain-containing protein n=1 Tax=Rhynchospora breviuscula TaxID=2022672 RepID=A0A9Q0CDF2_9POAL|nr:hypothetical protein LUZ63_015980 [Rhynchospora breviuscula]